MKRIKEWNFLFVLLLALLSFSCSSNPDDIVDPDDPDIPGKEKTFTASLEDVESRMYVENGHSARWTKDDKISLFDSNTQNAQYLFAGNTGDSSGKLQLYSKPGGTGKTLNANYAVYPYNSNIEISDNGVITLTLPTKQHYSENSFGLADNTLVAATKNSEDTYLKFKNVCGYYKIMLFDKDLTVKSITLKGNDGEKIAGMAQVAAEYDKAPVVTMLSDASTSITLDCGENGVKVGSTLEEATVFWMVVPPMVFDKGITLTITDINGKETTQTSDEQVVVERNVTNSIQELKDNHYAVFHNEDGWDESVYFGNGSQIHMTKDKETGNVKNMFAWAVDSKNEIHPVVAEMNENGIPSKITYGNMEIFVTRYDEATLDMTLFVDNEFVLQADGIAHELFFAQQSRAWADNNGLRNTIAVVQLVASVVEIAGGGVGMVAGVASGQFWAAGLAGVGVVSGIADFKEAYNVLFNDPQPTTDDFISSVLKTYSDNTVDIGKELKNKDSKLYKLLCENKAFKDLDLNASDIKPKGLVSLVLTMVDKIWGKSYNSAEQIKEFKDAVFISLPFMKKVTSSSAEVYAFYSYSDYGGVTNIEMKPGMRYYKEGTPSVFKDIWDSYSNDEEEYFFNLQDLDEETVYNCMGVYHETGHNWYFFGNKMTFKTKNDDELREALIQLYNSTDGDNWTNNDNWCSDKPVEEWYGITKDEKNEYGINLGNNNLTGKIIQQFPDEVVHLNFEGNPLTQLTCKGSQLVTLTVSDCAALKYLYCYNNQLTTLDVSGCTSLKRLWCYNNQLTALDVSKCTALTELMCTYNQLTTLDVSKCTALKTLTCYVNQLTTLDVSKCTALTGLNCSANQLSTLDVSKCTALTGLGCGGNQLTALDVSKCTALTSLACSYNQLTTLDLSKCTALTDLDCDQNQLTTLDVSKCKALKTFNCSNNQLTALDVSGCKSLYGFNCRYNQITTLDISDCMALDHFTYENNPFNSLNATNCISLEELDLRSLSLTFLDVSGCTSLKKLWCYSNPALISLNVSGCTALVHLSCSGTIITSVIPNWFSQLQYFSYDQRYEYWEEDGVTKYKDNGYGWWYPGEPARGYHRR